MTQTLSLPIGATTLTSRTEYSYDNSQSANVTEIREWNYYVGTSAGNPDRKTDVTYVTTPSYTAKNILNLPLTVTVSNGSGAWLSQTNYKYDSTVLLTVGATGVVHHDDTNFGSANTTRGNVTVTDRLLAAGASCPSSSCLETTNTYDITGHARQLQDTKGNTTTFVYTDNFFTDNGANPPATYTPPAPTNAFLTQVTSPLAGVGATYGYYFHSGNRASVKDQNGADSYTHFDSVDRVSTKYLPLSGGSRGWSLAQYSSATQADSFAAITSTSPSSSCTSCIHQQTSVDLFGRPTSNVLVTDPDGQTTVAASYDTSGRIQSVTNPYRSTSDPTYGSRSYSYDGMGRAIKVTHPDASITQTFYGSTVSAAGGVGTQQCAPSTCGLGYPTLSIDPSGKKRQVWVNGFGNTIEADEPQIAATAGTGSVTITGAEQSKLNAATPGKGTFTVSGTEKQVYFCPAACSWTWDQGSVSVSVNGGSPSSTSFGQSSTSVGLSQTLASYVNGSSLVTASADSSGNVTVIARTSGSDTNYPLSGSSQSNLHPPPSGSPGFGVWTTGMTGGTAGSTTYDSGSVWVTVNGTQYTVAYGQGSTVNSIATALQSAMAGAPVTITVSGGALTLTATQSGSGTNYSLSAGSSTSQPGTFSVSFNAAASGASLSGGADPGSLTAPTVTYYTYNLLGDLAQVVQGSQSRTFVYDALSRMTSRIVPESGTTQLYYTNVDGTLCSGDPSLVCRVNDARAITTTNAYDAVNRVASVSYSDTTPQVQYFYDQSSYGGLTITNGKGRLTGMSDGSGSSAWSYNLLGEIVTERHTISGVSKNISYAYNLDGSLASTTYPGGRVLTAAYSNAKRLVSLNDGGHNYVTSVVYAPQGTLASLVYGKTGTFPGITESYTYNNRLQLNNQLATSTAGSVLNLTSGFPASPGNNGEITSVVNNLDTGRTQSFAYDPLHRVISAQSQATSGPDCWGQSFGYDRWANLLSVNVTKCSALSLSVTATNNRLTGTGFNYDATGNMTADGINSYTYDAAGNLASAAGVSYSYDGNNLRVKKSNGTLYWRNFMGDTVVESDLSGTLTNQYMFFDGKRVARADSSGNVFYYFSDQLGSTRAITNSAGAVCYSADYTAFGGEISFSNTCPQNYKFTGYERDQESGLDYAIFRSYSSRLGRFMQPDPAGLDATNPTNPQTWNQYAYVLNQPCNLIDPLGLRCTIFIFGVGDNKGTFASLGIPSAASTYPYNGMGLLGGLLSAGFGGGGNGQDLQSLLEQNKNEPGGIDLMSFSGGAQTDSNVLRNNPDLAKNVVSFTYLSPGLNLFTGQLFRPKGSDTVVFKGSGILDFGATLRARLTGVQMTTVAKGHSFKNEFNSQKVKDRLTALTKKGNSGPCPTSAGGSGSSGFGGDEFDWMALILGPSLAAPPAPPDNGDHGPGSGWCPGCPAPTLIPRGGSGDFGVSDPFGLPASGDGGGDNGGTCDMECVGLLDAPPKYHPGAALLYVLLVVPALVAIRRRKR